jgi:hypothetical protein
MFSFLKIEGYKVMPFWQSVYTAAVRVDGVRVRERQRGGGGLPLWCWWQNQFPDRRSKNNFLSARHSRLTDGCTNRPPVCMCACVCVCVCVSSPFYQHILPLSLTQPDRTSNDKFIFRIEIPLLHIHLPITLPPLTCFCELSLKGTHIFWV